MPPEDITMTAVSAGPPGEPTSMSTGTVVSRDGTPIAFSRACQGSWLVVVDGAPAGRASSPSRKLVPLLAGRFTVYPYEKMTPARPAAELSRSLADFGDAEQAKAEAAIEGRPSAAGPDAVPPVEAITIPPVKTPDITVPQITADAKQAERP